MKIGFIGMGNMAQAILKSIKGNDNLGNPDLFFVASSYESTKEKAERLKIAGLESIGDLVRKSDIIFLGIKPQIMEEVLVEVKKTLMEDSFKEKIFVSMAAGVTIEKIRSFLSLEKIYRIMPNTPVAIGQGVISLSYIHNPDRKEVQMIKEILSKGGLVEEISQEEIHAVIGVSGSSPAYTYMYIEALMEGAMEAGISKEKARKMAIEAVRGAATLAGESDEELSVLRERVCSKKGTTIEAVYSLEEDGFKNIVKRAFSRAVNRSKEISDGK